MAYIHVYMTPIASGTDGTQVLEGTGLQTISVTLKVWGMPIFISHKDLYPTITADYKV